LQPVERQIKQALRRSPVIHQDESGLYVQGKRVWMHVTATKRLTHYQVHANRGTAALDANGILPGYQGTSVHDGWAAYEGYGCQHALCNVHLLRELLFIEETTKQPWAKEMQTVLLECKALAEQAREAGLTQLDEAVLTQARTLYQEVLLLGEQANPPPTEKPKRGRRKQSAARNLLDRLTKHQDAVLAFLQDLRVPARQFAGRARYSHGQGSAESFRLFPQLAGGPGFLPHSWLSLHAEQTGPSSAFSFAADFRWFSSPPRFLERT
jgi:transposase